MLDLLPFLKKSRAFKSLFHWGACRGGGPLLKSSFKLSIWFLVTHKEKIAPLAFFIISDKNILGTVTS